MIIGKVLPAMKEKLPDESWPYPLYIQQDNAKPHVSTDSPHVEEAASIGGWCIHLSNQPSNSPDPNVMDPGFSTAFKPCKERRVRMT